MITERSRRGIDAYRFRIYPTGSDVQILHTESIKSARVLIIATSLWSFNFIRRHTFYIMFKSGDCTGQVIPGIAFSIFQSRVNLELCAGALSSWVVLQNVSQQLAVNVHPGSLYALYFFESMVPSTGTRVPTPSYVMQPQKVADTDTRERPPTSPRHSVVLKLRWIEDSTACSCVRFTCKSGIPHSSAHCTNQKIVRLVRRSAPINFN